jgi:two-component system, response regulator PdtaR
VPGEIGGIDLARIICDRWPGLRLLVTSGYAERLLSVESLPSETPFLSKPYRTLDLVARVRAVLDPVAADAPVR